MCDKYNSKSFISLINNIRPTNKYETTYTGARLLTIDPVVSDSSEFDSDGEELNDLLSNETKENEQN